MKTVNADARILGFSVDETADVTKIRVPFERGEVVVTLSTADQVGPLIRALSKCGDPADVD